MQALSNQLRAWLSPGLAGMLATAGMISIPLTLGILMLVFGSLVAATEDKRLDHEDVVAMSASMITDPRAATVKATRNDASNIRSITQHLRNLRTHVGRSS